MWQAQSFCCLFEDCLRIPPFLSRSVIFFSFPKTKANHVGSTFCLRNTDVKEPLVWTVIPLLKPWAEPYPGTPDAISNTPTHPTSTATDYSTTLRRIRRGETGRSLASQRSLHRCTHVFYPEFHATRLAQGFWKPLVKRGWGWGCRRQEAGSTGGDSPSAECLSATCNLKDCSTDALYLCINYAKWPNQLPFPSSAWRARLWMHRLIPLPFCCEEQLPLSAFLFPFLGVENKGVTLNIPSLFGSSPSSLVRWHKMCFGILKDHRCFSYFSWFVICCKCCKTVG